MFIWRDHLEKEESKVYPNEKDFRDVLYLYQII